MGYKEESMLIGPLILAVVSARSVKRSGITDLYNDVYTDIGLRSYPSYDYYPDYTEYDSRNVRAALEKVASAAVNKLQKLQDKNNRPGLPTPPNPCPRGMDADDCIRDMPDTEEYSKVFQTLGSMKRKGVKEQARPVGA